MLMEVPNRADLNSTRVLSLDAAGRILDWISWQDAVCLYVREAVAWTLGDPCLTVHGGHNRLLGKQSQHPRCIRSSPAPATAAITRSTPRQPSPTAPFSAAIAISACIAASASAAAN